MVFYEIATILSKGGGGSGGGGGGSGVCVCVCVWGGGGGGGGGGGQGRWGMVVSVNDAVWSFFFFFFSKHAVTFGTTKQLLCPSEYK